MKVLTEKNGSITTVMLNRPEVRNAVDAETAGLPLQAFEEFEADPKSLVGVLCGNGGSFCSGYDLTSAANEGLSESYRPEGDGALGFFRQGNRGPGAYLY